jgi:flagellar hook-associated protein 2
MGISGSIDGLISGFDTSSIIETLMEYESQRVDIFNQRKTEFTNKLTTWGSIEGMLLGLKTQAALLANDNLWYAKSITSSDESTITVSATNEASPGTYFLTVSQLASNHQIASQGFNALNTNIGGGTIEIRLGTSNPTVITIDESNNTLTGLKDAINSSNADVTAAIVNDGSSNNPYRLVLTAEDTGAANRITFTANLSGGTAPSFSAAFDWTEKLTWNNDATADPVLTTGSIYTGSTNKTYTFTVGGTGLQTIGTGDIEINWTDGTNSGTITVSEANSDIALTGDGADGLSVYFTAGTLQAGDTFQVQAFAPTIQNGQDAIIQLGSSESGGSPISFHSSTNTVTGLIDGVTLELHSASSGPVEIKIAEDREQIKNQIKEFVSKYNEFQQFIDAQFSYTEDSTEAGVLLGDTSLILLHNDIRRTISSALIGRSSDMRMLSQAGVKFKNDGTLSFDESVFNSKINNDFEDLVNLFKSNGVSDNVNIEYISSTAKTEISASGYQIDITQVATHGSYIGANITNPADTPLTLNSTNNAVKLTLNGISSNEIYLDEKTYYTGESLAEELQTKINSDPAVAGVGVEVEWVDAGGNGHLVIYTKTYGSTSKVEIDMEPANSAHSSLGLTGGTAVQGLNVEGTINGEPASGTGRYLTGNDDNENTAGLKLLINLTEDQLVNGPEGIVKFHKGIASIINEKIGSYTDSTNGILKGKKQALELQINTISDQIERLNEQLERKRASLYTQFTEMEKALAQLQSQQQYLTAAIESLSYLNQGTSSRKSSSN